MIPARIVRPVSARKVIIVFNHVGGAGHGHQPRKHMRPHQRQFQRPIAERENRQVDRRIADHMAGWSKRGNPPVLFDCEPPKPRIEGVRVVNMNASNSWTETLYLETRDAHLDRERAKSELKVLYAKEAIGHGIRAKRSKSGAVSFDLVEMEVSHASVQ
jgi:hypothetical protein